MGMSSWLVQTWNPNGLFASKGLQGLKHMDLWETGLLKTGLSWDLRGSLHVLRHLHLNLGLGWAHQRVHENWSSQMILVSNEWWVWGVQGNWDVEECEFIEKGWKGSLLVSCLFKLLEFIATWRVCFEACLGSDHWGELVLKTPTSNTTGRSWQLENCGFAKERTHRFEWIPYDEQCSWNASCYHWLSTPATRCEQISESFHPNW